MQRNPASRKRLNAPLVYRRWQSAGFNADELKKLLPNVTKGLSFDDALWALQHWFNAGEASANGAEFELREVLRSRTIADLRRLIAGHFSGHDVFVWFRSGIPDDTWTDWKQTGLLPWEAAGFARLGLSPITAKQWAEAGLGPQGIRQLLSNLARRY